MRNRMIGSAAVLLAASMALAQARDAESPERTVVFTVPGADRAAVVDLAGLVRKETEARFKEVLEKVPALRDLIPLVPTDAVRLGTTVYESGESGIRVTLNLGSSWLPPAERSGAVANELADATVETIRTQVEPAWERMIARQKETAEKLAKTAAAEGERLKNTRAEVRAVEARLQAMTGRRDLSPDSLRANTDALELERQQTELDVVGLKARRAAIEEAIADQAKRANEAQGNDIAAQALSKMIETSEQHLQQVRAMHKHGRSTDAEVAHAELAVLEARARLAERANRSAEAMAQWNRELVVATIEQREKEARLAAATERLQRLVDAAETTRELARLRVDMDRLEPILARTEESRRQAAERLELLQQTRPSVEVKRPTRPSDG